jgi:hypothetical protein
MCGFDGVSPPWAEGRDEADAFAEPSSPCVPFTLTLSPGGRGELVGAVLAVLLVLPIPTRAGVLERTEPGHLSPVPPGQDLPIAPPMMKYPMPAQWVTIRSNEDWRKAGKFEKELSKDCAARRFREITPMRFRAYFKGEVLSVAFGHGLNLYDPLKKADRKLIYLFHEGDSTACTIQTITNQDASLLNNAQPAKTGGGVKKP